jgi:ribosomal protein S27E
MFKLTKEIPLPSAVSSAKEAAKQETAQNTGSSSKTRWEERPDGEIVRVSYFTYRKYLKCNGCGNTHELYTFSEGPHLFLCGKCGRDFVETGSEELNPPKPYQPLYVGVEGEAEEPPVDEQAEESGDRGSPAPATVEAPPPKPSALLDRIAQLRAKVGGVS